MSEGLPVSPGSGSCDHLAPRPEGRRLALYRAWRPLTFGDVVGQAHVTATLRNALIHGRLSHAYLFCGPRGTGKTSIAKILARAVNCLEPAAGEPCNRCSACESILSGSALDVLEIDAASHRGIDEIRDLREKARYAPAALRLKVYIVDEVHMLTQEAFNALLKTLEEPPAHVLFVLATTDPRKIPATIISRCQRFDFHRLAKPEVMGRLRQVCEALGVEAEDDVLEEIAWRAEGGLRDALSLLDQCIAFGGDRLRMDEVRQLLGTVDRRVLVAAAEALGDRDALAVLRVVDRLDREGWDLREFVHDLLGFCRELLLLRVAPGVAGRRWRDAGDLEALAQRLTVSRLLEVLQALSRLEGELRWVAQPRMVVEIALLGLVLEDADNRTPVQEDRGPVPAGGEQTARQPAAVRRSAPGARPEQRPAASEAGAHRGGAPAAGDIRAVWRLVTERVKRERRQLHALLEPARPVALRGTEFVLQFGRTYSFHCSRVADSLHKSYLERLLGEALGAAVTLRCVLGDEPGAETPGAAGGEAGGGKDAAEAMVTAALDLLGGRVVDVDITQDGEER